MRRRYGGGHVLSNKLFDDVLESDDTKGAVVRAGIVGDEDKMRFAFLEKVDNVEAAGFGASLDNGAERHVADGYSIFGVVGDEGLDEEHADKVGGQAGAVDGDARVTRGEDVVHGLFVENVVLGESINVLHRGHDLGDGFVLEVEDGGDDGDLVLVEALGQVAERLVQGDEGLEAALLVDGAVVLAENPVEELRGGPRDGAEKVHQGDDGFRHVAADGQAVADADGLGDDFAKDDCARVS